MNTRNGTIGTATPRQNTADACPAHCGRLPAVEGDHTDQGTLQVPEGHCGRYAATRRRAHAARVPHRPPADGETTRHPWDGVVSPEAPTMGVKPAAKRPAIDRDNPRQADLERESPLAQPNDARPRNTLLPRLLVGRAGDSGTELPAYAAGIQQMRASLGGPTTGDIEHEH